MVVGCNKFSYRCMKTFVTTLHSGVRPTLSRAISSMLVPPVYYSLRLVCNMITIIVLLVLLIRQTVASSLLSVDTEHGVERSLVYSSAFDEMLLLVDQDGSVRRLALTESDARYLGVTVEADTGDVYFASSSGAILQAHATSSKSSQWQVTTKVYGRVTVRVKGYNLGSDQDDIVLFSIRGVECSTLRHESTNSVACTTGHPSLTADRGQGIAADDIIFQTASGGWAKGGFSGDFVETKLADHSLKPIITGVEVSSRDVRPHALAIHNLAGKLYFSDITSRSIERIAIDGAVVEWDSFLPDVGLVYGIAIDEQDGDSGGFMYFTEAHGGTVSRVRLPIGSADANKRSSSKDIEVLVSSVSDPMGLALDPSGSRLFFTLRGGSIRSVTRDGSHHHLFGVDSSKGTRVDTEVRRLQSGTRLDGIAVVASEGLDDDSAELRLYWSEFGRAPALKRSTLYGTRVESLKLTSGDTKTPFHLVWPRCLAFGAGNSSGLIFAEYLGAIRRLMDPSEGVVETVAEPASYPAAVAIQSLMWGANKEGLADKYFTETIR